MNYNHHNYKKINYREIGFLNRLQMAQFLGVSERKLSTMMRNRQIPFLKLDRSVRFDLNEVIKALKKLTIEEI